MNINMLRVCKHYYDIMDCEFLDDDNFSKKMVSCYDYIVKNADYNSESAIANIYKLDLAMYNYIEDYNFSKKLKDVVDVSVIEIGNNTCFYQFIDYFLCFFSEYDKNCENVFVETSWI